MPLTEDFCTIRTSETGCINVGSERKDISGDRISCNETVLTDFTEEELKSCIDKAYDSKFDTEEIAPLVEVDDTYYMELFHGATIAFKDMALSILPHLMTTSAKKNECKE